MKRLLSLILMAVLALVLLAACGTPTEADELRALATPEEKAAWLEQRADALIADTNAEEVYASIQVSDLPINDGTVTTNSQIISSIHRADESASLYTKTTLSMKYGEVTRSNVQSTEIVYKGGVMYLSSSNGNTLGTKIRGAMSFEKALDFINDADTTADTSLLESELVSTNELEGGGWEVLYTEIKGEGYDELKAMADDIISLSTCTVSAINVRAEYDARFMPRKMEIDFILRDEEGELVSPLKLLAEVRHHNTTAPARATATVDNQVKSYKETQLAYAFELYDFIGQIKEGEHPRIYYTFTYTPYNVEPTVTSETLTVTDADKLEFELISNTERVRKYIYKDGVYRTVTIVGGVENELSSEEFSRRDAEMALAEWLQPITLSPFTVEDVVVNDYDIRINLSDSVISELVTAKYDFGRSEAYCTLKYREDGSILSWTLFATVLTETTRLQYEYTFSTEEPTGDTETPTISV
ncbi:MAG: hypothetical protein IJY24_01530 [Clostridia bacterium]|nr:hypothetical protein [Clostridia bacterium]